MAIGNVRGVAAGEGKHRDETIRVTTLWPDKRVAIGDGSYI